LLLDKDNINACRQSDILTPTIFRSRFCSRFMTRGFMSRCTVCTHPERWRIELLRAGGASLESLGQKFGVSRDAVHRHWHMHVTAEAKAKYLCGPAELETLASRAANEGESVLDYLRMVRTVLVGQLAAMSEANDARGATYVSVQLTRTLETIARVTGEIGQLAQSLSITNNVQVLVEHPQFIQLEATLLRALGPFPDARSAVVAALRELDQTAPAATSGRLAAIPTVIEHVQQQ
jgi:hypothetical protein